MLNETGREDGSRQRSILPGSPDKSRVGVVMMCSCNSRYIISDGRIARSVSADTVLRTPKPSIENIINMLGVEEKIRVERTENVEGGDL